MAIMDERSALAELENRFKGWACGKLEFRLTAEEDESADGEIELWFDGAKTPFCVQVNTGYMGLNEYGTDARGFWAKHHEMVGVQPADLDKLALAIKVKVACWDVARQGLRATA